MKYTFELIGNYVRISDSITLQTLYYLPVNVCVIKKLSNTSFQLNVLGENIVFTIFWLDVDVPDASTYGNIDLFLIDLAALLNLAASGGGGSVIYSGASPTTTTVGGLGSGSSISGLTISTILERILVPYASPAFSSFTSAVFGTFEVGQFLPSGAQTVNYTISTPSNIKAQPPNVGVPSSSIPSATFPVNPVLLAASSNFQITVPASTTLTTPGSLTVSLQGTNSNNVTFNTSGSALFRQRVFWGQSSNTSLTESEIEALVSSQLRSAYAGTFSFPASGYKYFCYPASMGTATTFTDTSNGFPVAMYGVVATVSVTNPYGVTENYRVHRTLNILGGTINIAIS